MITMLKKILSRESCAKCRVCCGFDRDDVWEIPVVTAHTAEIIKQKVADCPELEAYEDGYRFVMHFDDEGMAYCPMLTENGCLLGDDKPFDCRVWPFRINRISDELLGITVSPVCDTVSALSISKLTSFINEKDDEGFSLADRMVNYAKEHPYIIKPYVEDYPIIKLIRL